MKRLLLIMMTGTAIALSAGCGRQNGEGKDTVQTPAEALPDEVTKTDSEDIPGEDPVTDVYSYEDLYFDGYNNTDIMYKIPGINFSGAEIQKINSEIYDTLYHGIVEEEFANMSAGVSVICYEITYDWAVNGNILSLWITCNYDWEWTDYYVYNVDIKTEKEVSDADLIQAHGMSPEQYNDQVRKASVSPENAAQAKPFINENGELCVIGYMDSMAGADGYYHLINLEDAEAEESSSLYMDSSGQQRLITEEDALRIAREYWDFSDGDVDEETGYPLTIQLQGEVEYDGRRYYSLVLRWLVEQSHWSTVDFVGVDIETGECRYVW